jgi:ketosteroid isomerase-like protein
MDSGQVSTDTLRAVLDAFNAHDLDRIMTFFSADCVLEMPRGPDPWGSRYVGAAAVKEGLRSRFAGIPDVRYEDDAHFVSGDIGVSQWTLRGTSRSGEPIEVRGCDFYTFRDGKIVKKDSYWKIREAS